jgi:hypothetical protein
MTTKYFCEFSSTAIPEMSLAAKNYKISFQFAGSHTPMEIKAGETPLKIGYSDRGDDIFSPIRAKKATIQLIATEGVDLDAFYSNSDRECFVLIEQGSDVIFKGWLTAFDANEPFLCRPYTFELNAHCGLSSLKDSNFSSAGLTSFNAAIRQCLAATGLGVNYLVGLDTRISGDTGDPTTLYGFEAEALNGKTCHDALTHILESFVGDVEQSGGKWVLRGLSEQAEGAVTMHEYTAGGSAVGSSTINYSTSAGRTSPRRNITGANVQKEPAISYVEIKYNLGTLRNLLENGSFTQDGLFGSYSFFGWDRYENIQGVKQSPSGIKIPGRCKLWYINSDGTKVLDDNGDVPWDLKALFLGYYPAFQDKKYYESQPIELNSAQKAIIKGRFQPKDVDFARLEVYIYDSANPTTKLWLTQDGEWKEQRDFMMLDYTKQVVRVYGDDPTPLVWYPFEITSLDIPTKRSASDSTNSGTRPYTTIRYNTLKIRVFSGVYNNTVPVTTSDGDAYVIYDDLRVNFNAKNDDKLLLTYGFKNANYVRRNPIEIAIPFGGYSVATTGGAGRIREVSLNNYASVIRAMNGSPIVDAWTKAGQSVISDFVRLNGISRLRLGHKFGYSWEGDIIGDYVDGVHHLSFEAQSGVKYKPTAYDYDFKNRIASVTLKQLLRGAFSYVEGLEEGTAAGGGAVATTITNGSGKPKITDPDAFTDRGLIDEPIDFDTLTDNGEYRVEVASWDDFENAPIFGGTLGRLRVFETEGVVMQYYYPEAGGVHWREYSYDETEDALIWQPVGGWNIAAEGTMLAESTEDEPEPKSIKVVDSYNRGIGSGMSIDVPTLFAFEKQSVDAFIDRTSISDPIEVTSASNFNTFTADGSDYLISLATWTGSTNAPTGLAVGGRLTVEKLDGTVIQRYQQGGSVLKRTRQKKNPDNSYTWTAWAIDAAAPILTFTNDFNDMVKMGAYNIKTAAMPENAPDGADTGGMLHVFITDGDLMQRYYVDGEIYIRKQIASTWSDWEAGAAGVMHDTEADPAPDTVEVTTKYVDGVALLPTVSVYTKIYIDNLTTTDIPEPATDIINKYFTNARARAAISAGTGLSYDSATGVMSYTGTTTTISAVAPLYYNSGLGSFYWGGTTADVPESGGYLYYTDARARAAFTAGTGISIVGGVVSATGGSYSDAQARAAISVTGGVLGYNSTTGVLSLASNAYDSRYVQLAIAYDNPAWINTLGFNKITGLPATLSGHGITNAYTKTEVDSLLAGVSGLPSGGTTLQYLRGDRSWQTLNTTAVPEGTNLYYTDPRARAAISAGTGIAYSFISGVISSTVSQYTDPMARAAISAGTGLSYNASTGVMTNTQSQYTDAQARAAISVTGGVLSYSLVSGVISLSNSAYDGRYSLLGHLHDDRYVQLGAIYPNPTWLSTLDWAKIFNRPTTIVGYGITNAYTKTEVDSLISGVSTLPSGGTTAQYLRGDRSWQTLNTTAVPEGTSLYYTDARARGAVSAGTGLSYNSTTGVFTSTITQYTDTQARAAFTAGAGINISGLGVISSTIIQYTDTMARNALSGGTGISYNAFTGVITSTISQYTDPMARAAISAGTGLTYNSTTGVMASTITQYTDAMARGAFSAGTAISISGAGVISYTGNPLTGSGTTNYLPKYTGANSMGISQVFDNGSGVGIGTADPSTYKLRVAGAMYADGDGSAVALYLGGGQAIRAMGNMFIDAAAGNMYFRTTPSYSYSMSLIGSNVLMGTVTVNGSKTLQVTGGIRSTGQMQLADYASATSFTGTRAGLLGFDSGGNILTVSNDTFAPLVHNHNSDYYTKSQLNTSGGGGVVHWDNITSKPSISLTGHGHIIGDVTGLQSALDGKAAVSHGHIIGDITGLQSALDSKLSSEVDPFGIDSHWFNVSGSTVTLGIQRRNTSQIYASFSVPSGTESDPKGVDYHTLSLSGLTLEGRIFRRDGTSTFTSVNLRGPFITNASGYQNNIFSDNNFFGSVLISGVLDVASGLRMGGATWLFQNIYTHGATPAISTDTIPVVINGVTRYILLKS